MATLCNEELFVHRKRTISLKGCAQVIGIAVRLRIVAQLCVPELAQEVLEIFGLSAAHQLLWQRGLMKAYVPERGMTKNLLPRIETRKGYVENHHAPRTFRIPACIGVGHHPSDVVPEQIDILQAKTQEQPMNLLRHVCPVTPGFPHRCFPPP